MTSPVNKTRCGTQLLLQTFYSQRFHLLQKALKCYTDTSEHSHFFSGLVNPPDIIVLWKATSLLLDSVGWQNIFSEDEFAEYDHLLRSHFLSDAQYEIGIENTARLICAGRIDAAEAVISQRTPANLRAGCTRRTGTKVQKREEYSRVMFHCWRGFIAYIRWSNLVSNPPSPVTLAKTIDMEVDRLHEEDNEPKPKPNDDALDDHKIKPTREDQISAYLESISSNFSLVLETPGDFDVFAELYAKVLEHLNRLDETEQFLTTYAAKNPDRLLPKLLLTDVFSRHLSLDGDCQFKSKYLETMKELVKISPGHPSALAYVRILHWAGDSLSALSTLFSFLDFSDNHENAEAWRIFVDLLQEKFQDGSVKRVAKLWAGRKDWWPHLHFRIRSGFTAEISEAFYELLCYRAVASVYLLRQNGVQKARGTLSATN